MLLMLCMQALTAAVVPVVPAAAHASPESLAMQSAKLRQMAIEIVQLESNSSAALTLMMKDAGLEQLDTKWQQVHAVVRSLCVSLGRVPNQC